MTTGSKSDKCVAHLDYSFVWLAHTRISISFFFFEKSLRLCNIDIIGILYKTAIFDVAL